MHPAMMGRRRFAWSPATKLVFDGDSHVAYIGSKPASRAPVSTAGAQFANVGIGGQTWRMMSGLDGGSTADLQSALTGASEYALVALEGTNSLFSLYAPNPYRTLAQVQVDIAEYIGVVKAIQPLRKILLVGCPHVCGTTADQTVRDSRNQMVLDYAAALKANYRALGADAFLDIVAPGSFLHMTSFTPADFDAMAGVWLEGSGSQVHLSASGYEQLTDMISAALMAL